MAMTSVTSTSVDPFPMRLSSSRILRRSGLIRTAGQSAPPFVIATTELANCTLDSLDPIAGSSIMHTTDASRPDIKPRKRSRCQRHSTHRWESRAIEQLASTGQPVDVRQFYPTAQVEAFTASWVRSPKQLAGFVNRIWTVPQTCQYRSVLRCRWYLAPPGAAGTWRSAAQPVVLGGIAPTNAASRFCALRPAGTRRHHTDDQVTRYSVRIDDLRDFMILRALTT